ncbi:hypothetical protein TRFO_10046 [Tritrichomonas foetus]|uniref:DUF3447 domain-containing protein n=1 Tax=Tritrichomonas foetus TaxID=1144522 RepID=A0A1J4JB37_9EUKA|nr:hypothetical protein TRFO_10046 [Tritrichomonas foetus]|eukprot:OHS96368.1 hypothetical protein TRFO_10046 [Tritrichomonas foetus]
MILNLYEKVWIIAKINFIIYIPGNYYFYVKLFLYFVQKSDTLIAMITKEEIDNIIDLQDVIMEVKMNNIQDTLQYLLACPFTSDDSGYEVISRAIHLAVTYHPLSIPALVQLVKLIQQEPSLKKLDHVILHLIFHYLQNSSAFPSECGGLSFVYRCLIDKVFTEDEIYIEIDHFYTIAKYFHTSLFWIFAYFAPIIEIKDEHRFNFTVHLFDEIKLKETFPNTFHSFFSHLEEFKADNWKLHRQEVLQIGSMSDIIRRDAIDELREKASHPSFSIDQTIQASLFEPSWFLFDEPTLIQYAAFHHSINCFTFCQMMDADLHLYDNKNKMLSQFAVAGGDVEIIRKVEQLGCSFNDTLHVAVGYFWFDIFLWLQQSKGIALNIDTPVFGTILGSAAASGNLKAVQYCIENGIEVSAVNSLGVIIFYFILLHFIMLVI